MHTRMCPRCGAELLKEPASSPYDDRAHKKREIIKLAIIFGIVVFIIIALFINGHIAGIKHAKQLNSEIEAIEEVSSSDDMKLNDLQRQYDNLSDSQKSYVTSYDKLQKMQSMQKALVVKSDVLNMEKEDDIKYMDIDELNDFISSAAQIKEEYNALTDTQKTYIDGEASVALGNIDNLVTLAKETKESLSRPTPKPTSPPAVPKSDGNTVMSGIPCVFSDYTVTYNNFSLSSDYEGNTVIIENLTFKNLSSEARPFFTTSNVTLYQDGIELEDAYFVDGCDYGLSQTKLQQGASLDVQQAHVLRNTTSPVYIEITDWISFNGKKYSGVIPLS